MVMNNSKGTSHLPISLSGLEFGSPLPCCHPYAESVSDLTPARSIEPVLGTLPRLAYLSSPSHKLLKLMLACANLCIEREEEDKLSLTSADRFNELNPRILIGKVFFINIDKF